MNKKIPYCASAVIAALFAAQPTFAQSTPRPSDPAAAQPAAAAQPGAQSTDKNQMFVEKAATGGMYEVAAAKIAMERGQSDQVKQAAQMIQQDHQKANQQLMQIAQSKSLTVPKELDAVHQAKLQMLQKHQGADFDKAYLIDQVSGHVAMSLKFRDASKELQDPELKQFATTTLQSINQHGQHVASAVGWTGFESGAAVPASATERGSKSGAATPDGRTPGVNSNDRGAVGPSSVGDTTTGKDATSK